MSDTIIYSYTYLTYYISIFQVGKAEFLGRAIGKPSVCLCEESYKTPSLEWFQIYRGSEEAGELLAAFELFEVREKPFGIILWWSMSTCSWK